ncbi:MAG: transposase [Roseofilum sp. Belize Diploria]|nr:transposase [Roseofilum sp. Belize Diploria]
MKEFLVPELIPGQIVLIDNASFHPQARIEKLVSPARCEVIFLPTYSPDLNKIEHFWERLKKEVGKLKNQCESLYDAIIEAFKILS